MINSRFLEPIAPLEGDLPTMPSDRIVLDEGEKLAYEVTPVVLETEELELYLTGLANRRELCVVVPAYNEELVLAASLKTLSKVVDPEDIYVVSDGSTDESAWIAGHYTKNILDLKTNVGKARALELLINTYQLTERYQYVMFNDADSRLTPGFLDIIQPYIQSKPACIVGTVASERKGLISAFRAYEYGLSHRVFKQAQNVNQVVTVAPGCASLYRSDVLKVLDFSRQTLTEDFDLTLQIYQKNLGQVIYVPAARVITQDPTTLRDYWNQVGRWYTGFWQNVILHKIYQPTHPVNLEIWLVVSDALGWLFYFALAFYSFKLFLSLTVLSYLTFSLIGLIILLLERQLWALVYLPVFPLFQIINLASYAVSFIRAITWRTGRLSWQKVDRYATGI